MYSYAETETNTELEIDPEIEGQHSSMAVFPFSSKQKVFLIGLASPYGALFELPFYNDWINSNCFCAK